MAGARTLRITIAGDAKGALGAFGDVERGAGGLSSKIDSFGRKVGTGIATAFATDKLLEFGSNMLDLSGQLDAIGTKVNTVFEGSAGAIRKWADENNERFGVTDDKLAGLAANFGDLLKPMGFTADQAASMSKDVIGLAGALSAWTGGQKSAAEVSAVLAKAMLGERDGLKELGISISEADVQARLAAKGQDKLTGAALEQAKALATQELIFAKSTDAQKAWAAGGNKALEASNRLKAGWGELQEQIATKVVPILLTFADKVAQLTGWLSEHKEVVVAVGAGIVAALVPAFIAWAAAAIPAAVATLAATAPLIALGAAVAAVALVIVNNWDTIEAATVAVWDAFTSAISSAVDFVVALFENFTLPGLLMTHWDTIRDGVTGLVADVTGRFESLVAFITGVPSQIAAAAAGMWDGIAAAFKAAVNVIIRAWNSFRFPEATFGGQGWGPFSVPSFTVGGWSLPHINELAQGGIVTSPTLALIGERGPEAVVPLPAMGSSITVNVNLANHGVLGSQADVTRWFIDAAEQAAKQGLFGPATRRGMQVPV